MTGEAITLAPDLEVRVRAIADRQGLAPETALSVLLESALSEDETALSVLRKFQETVAALHVSMADDEAARSVSLEDWRVQSQSWIAAHRPADAPGARLEEMAQRTMSESTVYAIHLMPSAKQAIDDERDRLLRDLSVNSAGRWLWKMDIVLSSLLTYPQGYTVARESVLLTNNVRQILIPPTTGAGACCSPYMKAVMMPPPFASIFSVTPRRLR